MGCDNVTILIVTNAQGVNVRVGVAAGQGGARASALLTSGHSLLPSTSLYCVMFQLAHSNDIISSQVIL